MKQRVLVVAPHPDDEVLGVGGTMARLAAEGAEVRVVIVTQGGPPLYDDAHVARVKAEARSAHESLGIQEPIFLTLPAARLDTVPHFEINDALGRVFAEHRPDVLFLPFSADIHLDHQGIFHSAMVAARPSAAHTPASIYAYETLSETNWNAPYLTPAFAPNVFFEITGYLERKLEAMRFYASQLRPFPQERSLESLRALATLRGSTVGVPAAEAFVLIRQVV